MNADISKPIAKNANEAVMLNHGYTSIEHAWASKLNSFGIPVQHLEANRAEFRKHFLTYL